MNGKTASFNQTKTEELMTGRRRYVNPFNKVTDIILKETTRFREREEHSDVILNCNADMTAFNAHKWVLCEQLYFRKACKPENFKVRVCATE